MKAYQIVDFNNPISVDYFNYSMTSFIPVRDLLEIEQVQCVTPDTLPASVKLDPSKKRTKTQEAVLMSHYLLIKRLAEGEEFIIMEHDAFLWPERIDTFKLLLTKIPTTAVWVSGIAVECYTMSHVVAQEYCRLVETDGSHRYTGPMTILHHAGNYACKKAQTRVMWPLYGETGKVVFARNVNEASAGKGRMNEAPVTQYVNPKVGVTIKRNNRPINKINNPNVHFGYDI